MRKEFTMTLSESSVKRVQKELENYKKELLEKVQRYTEALAEHGIEIARNTVDGGLGKYIIFSKRIEEADKYNCRVIMYATDSAKIISEWQIQGGQVQSATISPLLMAEFGSGFKAENPMGVPGVGQGTFPGQTHAFDPGGWNWMDLDGKWHHSSGVSPSMPMYTACMQLVQDASSIAQEIFS